MSLPAVSVVIPCLNAAHTIGMQLGALRRQFDAPGFEVLIADNGSRDSLTAAIAPFRNVPEFSLALLDASEFRGSSYARNVGIRHAQAEVVLFCDADDVVSRTWVRNGLLSSQSYDLWTGESILLREYFFASLDEVFSAFDSEPPAWQAPRDKQSGSLPTLMGGNFGARRETMLALQGFDQRFAHYGDDNELAFRARRAGHRIPVAETARIAYRGKFSLKSRRQRGFRDARARRHLLEVHDAVSLSPVSPWVLDLARCFAATVLTPFRRRRASLEDLILRWSYVLGNAAGALPHRGSPQRTPSMLGVGLSPVLHERKGTDE